MRVKEEESITIFVKMFIDMIIKKPKETKKET